MKQFCTSSRYDTTLYTPNEGAMLYVPADSPNPKGKKAVIYLHGHGGSAIQWYPGTNVGNHLQVVADAGGYVCMAIDAGGIATWNNDAATGGSGAISGAYSYLLTLGVRPVIYIVGWSMGGGNGLQWWKNNPTKVRAGRFFAPMTNLDYFHTDGTHNTEIDAAYGNNYAVNAVGHKIYDQYTSWRNLGPINIVHGDADTTVPLAHSQAFVTGVGQPQVTLTTIAGGTHGSIFTINPPEDTLNFLDAAA